MPVGYRSSSTSGADDSFDPACVIPVPAGAASGDIVICALEQWHEAASHQVVTPPANFSEIGTGFVNGNNKLQAWWKRLTGSDAGSYSFTTPNQRWKAGIGAAITGALASGDPVEVFDGDTLSTSSIPTSNLTIATLAFLWLFVGNENAATITTNPTNFTRVQNSNYHKGLYRIPGATGAYNTSGGILSASTSSGTFFIAIKPAAGGADQDLNVGFFDNVESIFPITVTNQANQDLDPGVIPSSVQFFSPSVANQASQELAVGFIASTTQLFLPDVNVGDLNLAVPFTQFTPTFFAPAVANQANQNLSPGFIVSTSVLFSPSVANQSNDTFLPNFVQFSQLFFTPQVFNEGEQVFEPILAGNGSHADQIFEGLVSQGFLTGSIADRERARLLAKLVLVEPQALSLQDLYSLADEDPRILGLFGEVLPV